MNRVPDEYLFKSEQCRVIHYLLNRTGQERLTGLGVDTFFYHERALADKWYDKHFEIIKACEPQIFNLAYDELKALYQSMINHTSAGD